MINKQKIKDYLSRSHPDASEEDIARGLKLNEDDCKKLKQLLDQLVKDKTVIKILVSVSGAYHHNLANKISKSYIVNNLFLTASPKEHLFFRIKNFFDKIF